MPESALKLLIESPAMPGASHTELAKASTGVPDLTRDRILLDIPANDVRQIMRGGRVFYQADVTPFLVSASINYGIPGSTNLRFRLLPEHVFLPAPARTALPSSPYKAGFDSSCDYCIQDLPHSHAPSPKTPQTGSLAPIAEGYTPSATALPSMAPDAIDLTVDDPPQRPFAIGDLVWHSLRKIGGAITALTSSKEEATIQGHPDWLATANLELLTLESIAATGLLATPAEFLRAAAPIDPATLNDDVPTLYTPAENCPLCATGSLHRHHISDGKPDPAYDHTKSAAINDATDRIQNASSHADKAKETLQFQKDHRLT